MATNHKVALITGASKGIGRAIAHGLAKEGFLTILTGRDEKDLEKVSKEISKQGGQRPVVYKLDITDFASVKRVVKQIMQDPGRIDILVNNAGIHFNGTLELSTDNFQTMMETNLTAQFVLLKEVVPVMKRQRSGYIFNVVSRSGKTGFSGSGGYCASKFGMAGLSESLYHELVPQGIRVTALCPAWVDTQMATRAGTPLKPEQMIRPSDLFKTIRWLLDLSPGACVKEVVIGNPLSP